MNDTCNDLIRLNIRNIRTQRGITQEKLAFMSGMTTACISRLERENSNPTIHTLVQIANALKVKLLFLMDDDLSLQGGSRAIELQNCIFEVEKMSIEKQDQLLYIIQDFIGISKLF